MDKKCDIFLMRFSQKITLEVINSVVVAGFSYGHLKDFYVDSDNAQPGTDILYSSTQSDTKIKGLVLAAVQEANLNASEEEKKAEHRPLTLFDKLSKDIEWGNWVKESRNEDSNMDDEYWQISEVLHARLDAVKDCLHERDGVKMKTISMVQDLIEGITDAELKLKLATK